MRAVGPTDPCSEVALIRGNVFKTSSRGSRDFSTVGTKIIADPERSF